MRFSRNVFRLSYACHTFLSKCLACGSIQMSCVRSAPVIRSSRNVLRSITPAVCRLCAKQDGLRYVVFLFRRGSGSPFVRSRIDGTVIEDGWFTSGLRVSLWRSRRRTKGTGERGERKGRGNAENERDSGDGGGGAAEERFCVTALALLCFPRGVRWGCAPQTAPKSHWLSGLSSFGS